jgi:membrane protein insertase Oxa1/YidC/SpoIIIJ
VDVFACRQKEGLRLKIFFLVNIIKLLIMDNSTPSSEQQDKNQEKQTPHELVKKHLSDPNHEITEDEMEKLETKPEADPELEKKEKEKLDELKNETGKHPINPYDILDNQ